MPYETVLFIVLTEPSILMGLVLGSVKTYFLEVGAYVSLKRATTGLWEGRFCWIWLKYHYFLKIKTVEWDLNILQFTYWNDPFCGSVGIYFQIFFFQFLRCFKFFVSYIWPLLAANFTLVVKGSKFCVVRKRCSHCHDTQYSLTYVKLGNIFEVIRMLIS